MGSQFVSVIVAASGNSTRMGGGAKIFKKILGKPAIAYTLAALNNSKYVDEIIIASKDEQQSELKSIIKENSIHKFKGFATGGVTRQQSVLSGLKKVSKEATHIATHDAARILATESVIDEVICDGIRTGASATGVPMKDTIKLVDVQNNIVNTVDRTYLWHVHTPQVFEKSLYENALKMAVEHGKDYTDDCQLIEAFGRKVHMVMGSYSNLKLTTPDDIPIFEAILSQRKNAKDGV